MKKIALLFGLMLMTAAGTASAQTSVQLQLGFGAPRPYIAGDVFIGPSFVRPVYRPYYYYYPDRYPYYFYDPLPLWYGEPRRVIVYERGDRFFRRDFDRERDWRRVWSRNHQGHYWDRSYDRSWDRNSDRSWDRNSDRSWDRNSDRSWDRNSDRSWNRNRDRSWDRNRDRNRGRNRNSDRDSRHRDHDNER
jgi:hypothetical protein